MRRAFNTSVGAILASGVLLTSVLGWLVADRVRILKNGREVVLPVRPVDPRDLFKGDYAILGYDISRVDKALLPPSLAAPAQHRSTKTIYVTLGQQPDGSWRPLHVRDTFTQAADPSQIVMKGRASRHDATSISYGIERYFVPEGTGGKIEDLARTAKLGAVVAVDARGNAAIKGLVVDGKRVHEEPLF